MTRDFDLYSVNLNFFTTIQNKIFIRCYLIQLAFRLILNGREQLFL